MCAYPRGRALRCRVALVYFVPTQYLVNVLSLLCNRCTAFQGSHGGCPLGHVLRSSYCTGPRYVAYAVVRTAVVSTFQVLGAAVRLPISGRIHTPSRLALLTVPAQYQATINKRHITSTDSVAQVESRMVLSYGVEGHPLSACVTSQTI